MTVRTTTKLRRFGSGRVHLAQSDGLELVEAQIYGADATLAQAPVVVLCGSQLYGHVVVMDDGTRVNCVACRHIAGSRRPEVTHA